MAVVSSLSLKDIFSGSNILSGVLTFSTAFLKSEVEALKSGADLQALEVQLNNLFRKDASNFDPMVLIKQWWQTDKEHVRQGWIELAKTYDFTKGTVGSYTKQDELKVADVKGRIGRAKLIIEQMQMIQGTLYKNSSDYKTLENIIQGANTLISQAKNIINSVNENVKIPSATNNLGVIVSQLAGFCNYMGHPALKLIRSNVAPTLLEKWFASLVDDVNSGIKVAGIKGIKKAIRENWTGAEKGRRVIGHNSIAQYSLTLNTDIKTELLNRLEEFEKDMPGSKPKHIIKTDETGAMRLEVDYDPGSREQLKMDARLNVALPSTDGELRASIKNWPGRKSDFKYNNLGTTSIDAAITRSSSLIGGLSIVEAYKLATKSTTGAQEAAHDFAKMAIKADIAMGLSQGVRKSKHGAGYANILIINLGDHLKLYNLADMVLDDSKSVTGYDGAAIESAASNYLKAISFIRSGRTEAYLLLMTSYLNSIQVTIDVDIS